MTQQLKLINAGEVQLGHPFISKYDFTVLKQRQADLKRKLTDEWKLN